MQKLTFNHRQMKEIKVLETGLICVHYTHEQHGVNVHVFNNWKDFYDGHPNLMYLHKSHGVSSSRSYIPLIYLQEDPNGSQRKGMVSSQFYY